ncbi:HAMP domain-containing protein [Butyrivibrio sp. CB08]|uniref:histidine kinase n=1 Tax=Butyrivibrio sp. CB08 TaxID=2364879 RepID=UPI000EA9D833|nr:histidine kinase [Butyrivibrio sp. CB08]RKM59767.1 HAMP domain-containing protein [Butyrivibrio sp. CB08]
MKKIRTFWETLTIKNKIKYFTVSVFIAILAAILFDVWIVKLFMMDFNDIMVDNAGSGMIVNAIDKETEAFDTYVHGSDPDDTAEWDAAVQATYDAIYAVPLSYQHLGPERFAILQSLRTSYDTYCKYRNQVVSDYQAEKMYIDKLYDVYSMQDYLSLYAQRFVEVTMREGNASYLKMTPLVLYVPFLVAALGIVLFIVIIQISKMMNRSITEPVLKLASSSKKIAANDFFIEDIEVENQDEIGDLVTAFNKMKFATGEYIKALEEKREALDQLHVQELETLEIEKQLETMNLELLKSQINPHFLFNTLNVIAGMANLEDAATTEQMIEALSSLFRYNLKTQAKEALLSQELKVSRDYMYLQKMRFGGRVEFEVDCEVDENSVIVPTFTFQPILENAIIHGISPKVEGGKVFIKVRQQDDMLLIDVGDTGIGMDAQTLESIRKQLAGGEDVSLDEDIVGIGLGNINRRIRAMYPGSSFEIDSEKDKGTTIKIQLPLQGAEIND